MNRIWISLAAVVVLLLGTVVYWQVTASAPVQAAPARRGPIRQFVDELGKTRLPDVHSITMPFPGRIEPITLRTGMTVKAGETVARVSPSDLDNELAEARAAVERFGASLEENDDVSVELGAKKQAEKYVESMESTVRAADARKLAGQKKVEFTDVFLKRTRRLFDSGAKAPEELERAELDSVQSQVDYQQDVLIAESLKAMQAATILMPQMVADYINRKGLTHNVLDKQRLEARARLRQVELRNQRGTLVSPIDGVILDRPLHDEQFLSAGTLLLKIGRLEELEVEGDLLSQDVVDVRPGQPVEIYGPAVGRTVGRGVAGTVHQVYPAGFAKISSLGVEEQRVKVIVRFDPQELAALRHDRMLGVDYRVRLRVFTETRTGALVVPRTALFRGPDGGWQLFVIQAGRARLQPVEVGLINDEAAEITAGLADEELVVLAPEHTLLDGTRVRPQRGAGD